MILKNVRRKYLMMWFLIPYLSYRIVVSCLTGHPWASVPNILSLTGTFMNSLVMAVNGHKMPVRGVEEVISPAHAVETPNTRLTLLIDRFHTRNHVWSLGDAFLLAAVLLIPFIVWG